MNSDEIKLPAALERSIAATVGNQWWRLQNLNYIQTKDNQMILFPPNHIQRTIHTKTVGHKRIMHLKSRQIGISTYWLLRELDEVIWQPHTTCAVIAHDLDTVHLLFEMITRAYENMPEQIDLGDGQFWRKPIPDRKTIRMIRFPEIDSKIYVDLEIRGGTIHNLHISEAAFIENMGRIWTATQESVPPEGRIVVESTANGKGNWFYDQWKDGEIWHKLFFPWHMYEDNRSKSLFKDEEGHLAPMHKFSPEHVERTMTEEERKIMVEFELDIAQVAWYRFKLASYQEGMKHYMKQENPMTADEAFVFAEGRFYPEFSRALHVLPDHEPPEHVQKFASLDYGWSNPSSIGLWYIDYDGNCIRYDELYGSMIPVYKQCEWLKSRGFSRVRFADPSIHHTRIERDGKVETIAAEYRRYGIIVTRANNDKGAGFERVRDYFRLRERHRNPITGVSPAPTLYFCKRCEDTIREHEEARYARPSKAAYNQEAKEEHEKTALIGHAMDDTRYFIISRPPIPRMEEIIIPGTPRARIKAMAERRLEETGDTY